MKKLFFVLLSIILITGTSLAQEQDQDQDRDMNQDKEQDQKRDMTQDQIKDHLILRDGKMYQVKNGEEIALQNQLRLNNGTVVNPDGTYEFKNKNRKQLRDGECLDMEGKQYRNREQFEHRMEKMKKEKMKPQGPNKEKTKEKKKPQKGKN